MVRPFLRSGPPLGGAATIRWFPVQAHRPAAVGGKRHVPAVRSPNGTPIIALEGELLDRFVAREVVDPNDADTFVAHGFNGELPAVRGDPRAPVRSGLSVQRRDRTVVVDERQNPLVRARVGSGNIDESARA